MSAEKSIQVKRKKKTSQHQTTPTQGSKVSKQGQLTRHGNWTGEVTVSGSGHLICKLTPKSQLAIMQPELQYC